MAYFDDFLNDRRLQSSRRGFLTGALFPVLISGSGPAEAEDPTPPQLLKAIEELEPYLTVQNEFQDISRGKPVPHSLSEEKKREVGMTRDTWKLEIITDPNHPSQLGKQFSKKTGNAFGFDDLLHLAKRHAVRFAKLMTCLNLGCPLGMGIWEGVPLRELIWLTEPKEDLRRIFYYGYHNEIQDQRFQSSLPVGRVLEDPQDWPPVIVCYKLNGEWLDSKRGGPVRMIVPEAYGFKSVKWLNTIALSNLFHANDTYANGNNDIDSPMKSFAATLLKPASTKPGIPMPVTGYAQVGMSGIARVQFWVKPKSKAWPADDPYFLKAPWQDARILPPPQKWGGQIAGEVIPGDTVGFDNQTGLPKKWPLKFTKIYWAALLPGFSEGDYEFRCRTIDENGLAQPMPRPFAKSGRCAIETCSFTIKAG